MRIPCNVCGMSQDTCMAGGGCGVHLEGLCGPCTVLSEGGDMYDSLGWIYCSCNCHDSDEPCGDCCEECRYCEEHIVAGMSKHLQIIHMS